MKKMNMLRNSFFVLAALISVMQCDTRNPSTLRIYGSTTLEPFIKRAAAVYNKSRSLAFSVKAVGSNAGIDSLISGSCDIAMSSMEISSGHINRAKAAGVSLKPFLLGYDVIVPIVHPKNGIVDIRYDRLREIYAGKINRWSALGGADTVIDVVERDTSSGTYFCWHHDMAPYRSVTGTFTARSSNSAVLAYVAEHENAIGYISAAYLNPEVKPLKLNGIAITESDSLLSEYHLKRPLFLYVNEEKNEREAKTFIMFLLINEKGRKLLKESGFFSSFTLAPLYNAVEKMSRR